MTPSRGHERKKEKKKQLRARLVGKSTYITIDREYVCSLQFVCNALATCYQISLVLLSIEHEKQESPVGILTGRSDPLNP